MTADVSAGLVIGAAVGIVLVLLIVAGAAWWSWRYIRRQVRHGLLLWQRGALRARGVLPRRGPRRDVARMRLTLQDNLRQTERLLDHHAARDAMPDALVDLLPSLERIADGLDAQLRLWETEPNIGLMVRALPALHERVDTIAAQSVAIRASALRYIDEADRLAHADVELDFRAKLEGLERRPHCDPHSARPISRSRPFPCSG